MDKNTKIILAVGVAIAVVIAGVAAALFLLPGKESNDVRYVVLGPSKMDAWLAVNESEGYIAWEPYVSSAVVGGTGRVIEWSGQIMPHHPCCVVVASNSFIESANGEELSQRFIKAHVEATLWVNDALAHPDGTNYTLLLNIASDFSKRSVDVAKEAFKHLEYGYGMNSSFMSALAQFTDLYLEDGYISNQTFHDKGYTTPEQFVDSYVNDSYLEALSSVLPSPTILNPADPIRLGYLTGDLHQIAQAVAKNTSAFGGTSMFEKFGLNVVNATAGGYASGGVEMTAFIEGAVDIGYLGAPPAIINKISKSADTVILASANSEGSGIVVGVDSHIQTLADLKGHVVATPGETSIQHLLLKTALKELGIALVKA